VPEVTTEIETVREFAREINKDMVVSGFWPDDMKRNYGEAVALIMTEIAVEALDSIRNKVSIIEKHGLVEEIADAVIRHLDLVAGLGYLDKFCDFLSARCCHKADRDVTMPDIAVSSRDYKTLFPYNDDMTLRPFGSKSFAEYSLRKIFYPLLHSLELYRKDLDLFSDDFVEANVDAFCNMVALGFSLPGFYGAFIAKVQYNKTRAYRHGKAF